jgi:hypothetical protein
MPIEVFGIASVTARRARVVCCCNLLVDTLRGVETAFPQGFEMRAFIKPGRQVAFAQDSVLPAMGVCIVDLRTLEAEPQL